MIFDPKTHLTLVLRWIRFPFPYHPEVFQGKAQIQLEVVLADASVEDLPESELTFDNAKGMLYFGAEVGFRRLNQIQKPARGGTANFVQPSAIADQSVAAQNHQEHVPGLDVVGFALK